MMCASLGKMCPVHKVAWVLVWIGAINWGLVGAFQFDLVQTVLQSWPSIVRILYVLVGLSALMLLLTEKCKACMTEGKK